MDRTKASDAFNAGSIPVVFTTQAVLTGHCLIFLWIVFRMRSVVYK